MLIPLTFFAPANLTLQSYGFGGGTNAANTVIPAGGFDPFVGLYLGSGPTATLLDGTADNLSNYALEPSACPPAGLVTIGSVPGQCGDVRLQFANLAAGVYTIVLTDANFEPVDNTLGDGFNDFTLGAFTTCYDANDCNSDSANWALDVTTSSGAAPVPEPATLRLGAAALVLAAGVRKIIAKDI